ncbi:MULTISPECIES: hypothetical protein [Nostoc]|uniref:Ferredoxin n=1 Tax=Nostoc paludosum FACHB-159 TaxID=2692908 RepID=A0ABR8KMQ5_9NOSO|nr:MULTISPECIES: hypothetical protein [Nostoc]MBD2683024.1 hypothetical protein [Nostoc sp. FACHB-857]MBD2739365.1 hypothetical protein [Nostoc paludosum FACHB-159]
MKRPICPLEATKEWLYLESIDYICECLEACLDASMLADLREIFPRQALRVASIKVCASQREKITYWLQQLNESDLAA